MSIAQYISIYVLLLVSTVQIAGAQHDLGTTFLKETWASSFHNPAWVPEKRVHIGLPSVYFNSSTSSVNIKSLIDDTQSPPILNIQNAINSLGEEAVLAGDVAIHPIYFSIAFGNYRLGLEYSFTNRTSVIIPTDFLRFVAFGNAPYIDQTLELGPQLYSTTYQQLALPFSYEKNKWTFGIRPALLHGLFSVNTKKSQLDLYTDPEFYQLTVTGDYLIESSSILQIDEENNFGTSITDNIFENSLTWKNNTGVSLDLGVRYKYSEFLTLGASFTGIGQITWDKNVTVFKSSGNETYEGIDLGGLVDGDSLDVQEAVDSLVQGFQLQSAGQSSFKTGLGKNIYFTGHYKINSKFDVGAILYGEFLNGKFNPAFSLNGRIKAGKILAFGLSYGARYKSWTNLGANLLLQFGPVQLFAATDNILSAFDPLGQNSANGRFGLAVAFGKKKEVFDEPGLH